MEIAEIVILLQKKLDMKAKEMEEAIKILESGETEDAVDEMTEIYAQIRPALEFINDNADFAIQALCGPRKFRQAMKTKRASRAKK